jgi:hypothetical protein
MMDKRFLNTPEVSELIKKLRGGNLIDAAAALVVIFFILQISGVGIEGFQIPIVTPNGGVHRPANGRIQQQINRPNPFQPPMTEHKYPLDYDLFLPRRTCYADRPSGSQIMAGVNPQSSREELTQLSTNVVRTQTQMSGFVKMGK